MGWNSRQPVPPKTLFNIRIGQIIIAIAYLALLSYSGVHRGWWYHLEKPLGFGSTSITSPLWAFFPTIPPFGPSFSQSLARPLPTPTEPFLTPSTNPLVSFAYPKQLPPSPSLIPKQTLYFIPLSHPFEKQHFGLMYIKAY